MHLRTAILATSALALAACSGGGTSQVPLAVAAAPPPAPSPAPSPPPPLPPPPAGANGLESPDPFVVLGIGYRYQWPVGGQPAGPPAADPTERVAFRQAAGGGYEIELPGHEAGRLRVEGYNGAYDANGWTSVSSSYSKVARGNTDQLQSVGVTLERPAGPLNPSVKLSYTSFGSWEGSISGPLDPTTSIGNFAYGIPTRVGDVPVTGTATYRADVYGHTSVVAGTPAQYPAWASGSAELRFDYGAGTLAGHMDAALCDWGCYESTRYLFRDTVYARGATAFSGKFLVPGSVPGSTADSFFEGHFTGPGAAELLARFQVPFLHPESRAWGSMYGIWVGKKD